MLVANKESGEKSENKAIATPWKPRTLSIPVLVATILTTFALLAVVGYLHLRNHKYFAILIATNGIKLNLGQLFEVRYLPTILVVLYGIWISVIDLDVKRLEPCYQLSSESKIPAESPLTCTYDTAFVGKVIFRALRARSVSQAASDSSH